MANIKIFYSKDMKNCKVIIGEQIQFGVFNIEIILNANIYMGILRLDRYAMDKSKNIIMIFGKPKILTEYYPIHFITIYNEIPE